MRRLAIPALAVAGAAALLALLGFGVAHLGSSSSIDASVRRGDFPVAPHSNLALPVLGRPGTQSLADLRGKVVVLNVFASWCDPARPRRRSSSRSSAIAGNATILGVTYLDNSERLRGSSSARSTSPIRSCATSAATSCGRSAPPASPRRS